MKFPAYRALVPVTAVLGLSLLAGCSSSSGGGTGSGPDGGGGFGGNGIPGGAGGTVVLGASGTAGTSPVSGGGAGAGAGAGRGKNPECSNGIDDDGDGLIDGFDPECTGPLDNDEGSFATGIPGDNRDPKWQDCFFDGNSGAGDDGCRYSTDCLTGKLPQTDKSCVLAQNCLDFCLPLTPNGCDCFGCCTITAKTGSVDILTGAGCSLAKIGDASACPVCTKSTSCNNTCGTCELCPGKTVADLPASCTPTTSVPDGAPPPPAYTCDSGQAVCTTTAGCPVGSYCELGCCLAKLR